MERPHMCLMWIFLHNISQKKEKHSTEWCLCLVAGGDFPPTSWVLLGGHWIRYPCFPFQSCLNKKCCIWQKNSITACPLYVISRQSEERWITKRKIKYWFFYFFLKWKYFTILETELPKLQPVDGLNKNCTSTALKVAIWCLLHSREAGWSI